MTMIHWTSIVLYWLNPKPYPQCNGNRCYLHVITCPPPPPPPTPPPPPPVTFQISACGVAMDTKLYHQPYYPITHYPITLLPNYHITILPYYLLSY